MVDVLLTASVALAGMSVGMVVVLVSRRLVLSVRERRRTVLERRLEPAALDVIDGEIDPSRAFSRRESHALAAMVARYSRRLAGDSRGNVARFFVQRGDVAREIRGLRSRRVWRRASSAFALGDMASHEAVGALIAALDDRRRDVRAAAARSLGLLGSADAVPRLVECLAAHTVPEGVAGFALLSVGDAARGPLRGLLAHEGAGVRSVAAELLGFVGSAADGHALIGALADPSADVRAAAARALGRVGDDEAAAAVRVALDDRMPFVRTAAAHSLAALDDIDATDALARQAQTDAHEPAQAAARALALVDPDEAVTRGRAPGASRHLLQAAGLAALDRR
jgi:hypothetical protein